ncbi:MGMT family protein [Brevibacterium atlanticum]|uniref:MGMT family protein n=1 Tax=Brevibacterium atlanticum TaxID=2697563 RepID=UPI001D18BF2B|nr:MGMT family protein [Brevibacterium atlanticum]
MMDEAAVERVLRIVELVPAARVVAYGTVGAVAGCSPRYVGRVMKEFGSNVTWWRVVNAAGVLPPEIHARARLEWESEGTPHSHRKVERSAFLGADELDELWHTHGIDPECG